MIIYMDLVFLLNCLSDALALYITVRLSGLSFRIGRLMFASFVGGVYGLICQLPVFNVLRSFPLQLLSAALLITIFLGKKKFALRILIVFYVISCMIGGIMTAVSNFLCVNDPQYLLKKYDWKVFFLASFLAYIVLSFLFRGSAKHYITHEIYRVVIAHGGFKAETNALLDTGHTLKDPYTGKPILTVWYRAVHELFTDTELTILERFEQHGNIECMNDLAQCSPGKFRVIPYRAVGLRCSMLPAFQSDSVMIGDEVGECLTVALSPTPLSDGSGYAALWCGERKENSAHDTLFKSISA